MRKEKKAKRKGKIMWGIIYIVTFIAAFGGSVAFKMKHDPFGGEFKVKWNDTVGKVYTDIAYGEGEANKFDLYVPAGDSRNSYGLVVYLHAGGFTSGDKSGDGEMLEWLCSKGYVAAGINYTLVSDDHPDTSVYSQSMEIREIKSAFGTSEYDEEIKDISALLWVNENSVPTLVAYGKYDKVQPYEGSLRLLKALEDNNVPHDYYLCEHSGHGLQNDNKVYGEYMRKILEYLDTYMPIK